MLALSPFKASCKSLTIIPSSANTNTNVLCIRILICMQVWFFFNHWQSGARPLLSTLLTHHFALSLCACAQCCLAHLTVTVLPHSSLHLSSNVSNHDHLAHPSPHPVPCVSTQCRLTNLNSDPTLPHHPHFTLTQCTTPSPLTGAITLRLMLMCKDECKHALHSRSHLHVSAVLCQYPMMCLPSTSSASLFFGRSIP